MPTSHSSKSNSRDANRKSDRQVRADPHANHPQSIESAGSWSQFEARFIMLYPDFSRQLLTTAPEITPMELRVAAMVKSGLTSTAIGRILKLSTRGVESHRYRVRKKMKAREKITTGDANQLESEADVSLFANLNRKFR